MAVYVDTLHNWPNAPSWWPGESCHLMADTIDELITFAGDYLGMPQRLLQGGTAPHFDLSTPMRARAVSAGALEVDYRFIAKLIDQYRLSR